MNLKHKLIVMLVCICLPIIGLRLFYLQNRVEISRGVAHLVEAQTPNTHLTLAFNEKMAILDVVWSKKNKGKEKCELTTSCSFFARKNVSGFFETLDAFLYRLIYIVRPQESSAIFYSIEKERPLSTLKMVQHVKVGMVAFYRKPVFACNDDAVRGTSASSIPLFPNGSEDVLEKVHETAEREALKFYATTENIAAGVADGELVPLYPLASQGKEIGDTLMLCGVSNPFVHEALRLFITRLSAQYYKACDKPLVVTSLARTTKNKLANASEISVHPAGIAADLRIALDEVCRMFLTKTLTYLNEKRFVLSFKEYNPPHIHAMVLPTLYKEYVEEQLAKK